MRGSEQEGWTARPQLDGTRTAPFPLPFEPVDPPIRELAGLVNERRDAVPPVLELVVPLAKVLLHRRDSSGQGRIHFDVPNRCSPVYYQISLLEAETPGPSPLY